jgi:hypothetical protein
MSNLTTENFLKVMSEFNWPDPEPVFYRLYYDQTGMLVCYSMEDLPGTYVEIDQATYALSLPNVRVVDKKIVILKQSAAVSKLQPSDTGTPCDPCDVCVVTKDKPYIYWSIKTHEID